MEKYLYNNRIKSARIDYKNDYDLIREGLMNPYCYNFGHIDQENSNNYSRTHCNSKDK